MKNKLRLFAYGFNFIIALFMVIMTGCEPLGEQATGPVPEQDPLLLYVTYGDIGKSITLTGWISGHNDFIWSLNGPAQDPLSGDPLVGRAILSGRHGYLSRSSGKTVLYTVTSVPSGIPSVNNDFCQDVYFCTRNRTEPYEGTSNHAGMIRIVHIAHEFNGEE